jgi:hypothetical protein
VTEMGVTKRELHSARAPLRMEEGFELCTSSNRIVCSAIHIRTYSS